MINLADMPVENIVSVLSHQTDEGLPGNASGVIAEYMRAAILREREACLEAVRAYGHGAPEAAVIAEHIRARSEKAN